MWRLCGSCSNIPGCKQGYHLTPSLKGPHHWDHTRGACQNHTHFGPHGTPSAKICRLTLVTMVLPCLPHQIQPVLRNQRWQNATKTCIPQMKENLPAVLREACESNVTQVGVSLGSAPCFSPWKLEMCMRGL